MGLKLAVFISGRGSNMEALVKACAKPDYPAEITLVLSNNPDAAGLVTAQDAGIPTAMIDHRLYKTAQGAHDKAAFEAAIMDKLAQYEFDLICLAGFMRLLSAEFVTHYQNRIINIHPSLLPAYKGLDTHARALEDGAAKTGCTVHYVVAEMDAGPIILQKEVAIKKDDTPETLAARVLVQEHIAYPQAIAEIAHSWPKAIDRSEKIG